MKTAALIVLGLTCLIPAFASIAAAEALEKITYDYYDVQYAPGQSVSDMIARQTPLSGQNGHRYAGVAQWRIAYDTNEFTCPTIDVCRLANPTVTSECQVTLARLRGGPPEVQKEFKARVEETRRHELEHCRIALSHASRLLDRFNQMGSRRAKNIKEEMQAEHSKIVAECRADQARFDHVEYGYDHHLHLEGLQRMVDAGFNVAPPTEGRFMPQLNSRQNSRKSNRKNQKTTIKVVVPEGTEDLAEKGIFKDENGVWRNY